MDSFLDEPAVVLLAVAFGALLFLLEVALPTLGLAGTAGVVLGGLAVWGVDRQDAEWWPLLGIVAAILLWGALVAMRRSPAGAQASAAVLFAGGALGFAVLSEDSVAIATAVLVAVALPAAFPQILRATARLLDRPPQVGMESLVGTPAEVVEWDSGSGRVRVHGSLWTATGPPSLEPGDRPVIVSVDGMSVVVGAVASAHG